MKSKQSITTLIVLLLLFFSVMGGYLIGKRYIPSVSADSSNLPPLTKLDIPAQTVNGITAKLESYYADGLRLVFAVRITGEGDSYHPDIVYIKDNSNQMINAGYGFTADTKDTSLYLIDVYMENPFESKQFDGVLEISVYPFIAGTESSFPDSSSFVFEFSVPVKPVQKFTPKQTVTINNVEMTLEELWISPAFTYIYLCYNKPSKNTDWMIGDSEFIVDSRTATFGTYLLLFDSEYGDVGKGIEPNWSPPIEEGKCVKLGYSIGSENPKSIKLHILTLSQPLGEYISEDELNKAYEKLSEQGIDMEWKVFDYGNGGGGSGPVYNKLPEGMTEEQGYQAFIEALGYVYKGPWEFTINIP